MKFSPASVALTLLTIVPFIVRAIDPITIKVTSELPVTAANFQGTKFFYPNGTEFYIVGVAYQPAIGNGTDADTTGGFVDPLGDPDGCSRDIPLLAALGVNVIRTYAINTSLDHSECIQAFANAG
jgi:1,3-beta-glucanosyltransferase GAS1